jgi:hypothetical protein
MRADAEPTSYQKGIPISILPAPPGAIVVYGVKETESVFDGSTLLNSLELLKIKIWSVGKKADYVVKLYARTELLSAVQFTSLYE